MILRADGKPTYNLANVADDIDMGITYVIRGDDHIMNTYRQLHLYSSLNNQPPQFAHFPMILGAVEKGGELHYERLSKRNTAVDVRFYRSKGFCRKPWLIIWRGCRGRAAIWSFLERMFWLSILIFRPDNILRRVLTWTN